MSEERITELEDTLKKNMVPFFPRLRVHGEVLVVELTTISECLKELFHLIHGQEYVKRSLVERLFYLYTRLDSETGYLSEEELEKNGELIRRVLNEVRDIISIESRYMK
ncbi:hypothetical protein [Paenibacillus sp. 481]|uniref:hypothetical protein n=1 Tax=Paenibacillus sp. 481 TaxID=2835869 RepID=UPI001E3AEA20|nr:hypothetical protein [Paenibacillus sp. 481]UHA74518.1 hypothetical protein KIK04_05305 [Paenibacillus sp. 481]